ncbi:MAG: hypothetical protein HY721_29515, partial [Planctomycetes bacterium]|nr:hypothetical protein [Planctomycetota bacterium]
MLDPACALLVVLLGAPPESEAGSVAAAERAARFALAALDLDRAGAAVAELVRKRPDLEAAAAPLREEVRLARAAWEPVRAALEAKQKEKKPVSLQFARGWKDPAKPAPRPYQVLDLSGCALRVQTQGAKGPETRSVLSLEPASLAALASLATVAVPAAGNGAARPELREGLALLLLFHRGPEAARQALTDPAFPADRRRALEEKTTRLRDLWLEARLEAASKRAADHAGAVPSPPADAWDDLAGDAAELIAAWRKRPDYAAVRPALRKLFLEAREAALWALPIERLVHAKEAKREKGLLELSYDFSSEDQVQDFRPVMGTKTTIEWVKAQKTLKLRGEARLLTGSPFRGKLAVSGNAASFNAESPNVNLGLWTDPEDCLSSPPGLAALAALRGGRRDEVDPGEASYFVLGMGLRLDKTLLESADRKAKSAVQGLRTFLPPYLREPSFVLASGARGKEKGLFGGSSDVLWSSSAAAAIRGPFQFTVDMDASGKLQWTV